MRRRPLMNTMVMAINLIIIFLGFYFLFYIIGGAIQSKIYDILINIVDNTTKTYYWLYFVINSVFKYGIIVLAIVFSVKYTFKFFVCYKDDGEKVHNITSIALGCLLLYSNYSMYQSMLTSFKAFDSEKLFLATEALRSMWSNLQSTLTIVFIIINIGISIGIFMWVYKSKDNFVEKCDFRI